MFLEESLPRKTTSAPAREAKNVKLTPQPLYKDPGTCTNDEILRQPNPVLATTITPASHASKINLPTLNAAASSPNQAEPKPPLVQATASEHSPQNKAPKALASVKMFPRTIIPDQQLPWYTNTKRLKLPQDLNSSVHLFVLPDRLPEPILAPKTLAELYYTTQTTPLAKLLPAANKTLSTDTYQLFLLEGKLAVVHSRIEELKRANKWSLRQRVKFKGPGRAKVHWDILLDEMEWMRNDFKEERKLKTTICYEIAGAIKDYWSLGKDATCIKPRPIVHIGQEETATINPKELNVSKVYESLVPNCSTDAYDQPKAPFSLNIDVANLNSASKEMLDRMPMQDLGSKFKLPYTKDDSLSITPITKFLTIPETDSDWQRLVMEVHQRPPADEKNLQPNYDGPIFASEFSNKRYAGIRPPPPPHLKYLDYRTPTIWLPQDDKKLVGLAKECLFNWDLISAAMLNETPYSFQSNIERRTPWQCFERWLQLTPSYNIVEMRGQHARAAQIWLEASMKAQSTTKRRISPLGVGVESIQRGHRRLRWASMFDGMRKSMRNRENMSRQGPQVHKKFVSTENLKQVPTPGELSKLKYDRDNSVNLYSKQRPLTQTQSSARLPLQPDPTNGGTEISTSKPASSTSVAAKHSPESNNPSAPVPFTASVPPSVRTGPTQSNGMRLTPEQIAILQRQSSFPQLKPEVSTKQNTQQGSTNFSSLTNIPRISQSMQHPHVLNLINQIAAQYPQLSSEQVQQIAHNKIQKYIQLQKQKAAAAAASASASATPAGITGGSSGETPTQLKRLQVTQAQPKNTPD